MIRDLVRTNKTFQLEGKEINYNLIKRRIRNPRIEIKLGVMDVIVPKNFGDETRFIADNSRWVLKKYALLSEINNIVQDVATLSIFGEPFKIEAGEFAVNFDQKTISMDASINHKKKLNDAIKNQLLFFIKQTADEYAQKLNTSYKKIRIRRQRSKWASYSNSGSMSFNFKLAFVPKRFIQYIVFHELVHSKVFAHNKQFWSIIDSEFADRKAIEKSLLSYWLMSVKISETIY